MAKEKSKNSAVSDQSATAGTSLVVKGETQATAEPIKAAGSSKFSITTDFTRTLAAEIVKNLSNFTQITSLRFPRPKPKLEKKPPVLGEHPLLLDTSVLIDGRIVSIVNSGFLVGTLIIPKFVLGEVQHIADSTDSLRRAKGRRGLEVLRMLQSQKANDLVKIKIIDSDVSEIPEVDHKLVKLAQKYKIRLATVDFNLAQVARAQKVKVLSVYDLSQALKLTVAPGEELLVKVTHEGKERAQGVGYLSDGTMIVIDEARDKVGQELKVTITKIHQTPAGQLFFARLK